MSSRFHFLVWVAIPLIVVCCFAACERTFDQVLDPAHSPPRVISASLSQSSVNTDSINIGPVRSPGDILPISVVAVAKVQGDPLPQSTYYRLYADIRDDPIAAGELKDDGLLPDLIAFDSLYYGSVSFTIQRSFVGPLLLEVFAQNARGHTGTVAYQTLTIVRLNRSPILSNLIAPDTVDLSLTTQFLITVDASDPDGLADIVSVTRKTPSGMVLNLNDSGVEGDVQAGDGRFSESVEFLTTPSPGPYDFEFKATDRSGSLSNVIIYRIVIVP